MKNCEETPDAQDYVDHIAKQRGFVLPYHKWMARADLKVLNAANALATATVLEQRLLDAKTKELLFILSLTVLRADPDHIATHIRRGLALGLDSQEILEAIELALPEAGVVAFQHGFQVWAEVVGLVGIEPSAAALEESGSA
ncbi:MAG: carboxymuconolactone decarboxylase family protein [Hyphomicrobiales bacterium]|nr:MAG: carboxymuconolactone decarboxylase family protein [Hyphomicrobiales bacterium]